MLKDRLKAIKADMRDVRGNRAACRSELCRRLREVERDRRIALGDYEGYDEGDWLRASMVRCINNAYDHRREVAASEVYDRWHRDQVYYLIYADGSEAIVSAEDILAGEKLPRLSGIAYAELSSADGHYDTETGELDWYSADRMQACGYDYEAEDNRKWQYETAIQFKFFTPWSLHWRREHPDFVPQKIA